MILLKKLFLKLGMGFVLMTVPHLLFGQEVQVLDVVSRKPIYLVSIKQASNSEVVLTNEQGRVNLKTDNDTYTFSHSAYEILSLSKSQLQELNHIVLLKEKIVQIDEVIVYANKWEQDKSVVPNEILSLTKKEVAFANPQTSADMIGQSGQVYIQKSQLGGGSPMIRGFSANSVLILMDGIRINNAIYRSGNLQNVIMMDPNLMENSEVIFGPGSSIYGSDALGGVMSFQTLKPQFGIEKKIELTGESMLRYSTANKEKTGHLNFNIYNKSFSNVFGFTYGSFGDLRTGSQRTAKFPDFGKRTEYVIRQNGQDEIVQNSNENIQRFSRYSQYNLMNKFSLRVSEKSNLTHQFFYTSSSNIPRYDRLIVRDDQGDLQHAAWYYGPQKFMLNSLTYTNFNANRFYDGLKVALSHQNVEESRYSRKYQADDLISRVENVKIYAVNVDLDKKFNKRDEFFYGIEFLLNDVDSRAKSQNIVTGEEIGAATRYPDGGSKYMSAAFYGSLTSEITQRLNLTMGLRYTQVYLDSKFIDKTYFDFPYDEFNIKNGAISGTFGMVIKPSPQLQWNLLFSTGFRVPNLDDVGKVFDSEPGIVVVPNEQLKPEFTYNYESGIHWKISEKVRIDGVLYYTSLIDAMVRRPFTFNGDSVIIYDGEPSEVQALVNAGEAFIWGYSLGIRVLFSDRFSLVVRINNNEGEDEVERIPLRHTNPFFGKVALAYQKSKFRAELFSNFQGKRSFEDLPPSEQNKTHLYTKDGSLAWITINARASYHFSESFGITAALENILDKHYRTYSSGISAPGINGIVSARYTF